MDSAACFSDFERWEQTVTTSSTQQKLVCVCVCVYFFDYEYGVLQMSWFLGCMEVPQIW